MCEIISIFRQRVERFHDGDIIVRFTGSFDDIIIKTVVINIFYGDMDKCMRYAQKAIGDDNLDNVSVIMALNVYAGMSQAFLYNNGFSIAYCPLDRNLQVSAYMVHHEANGHGFGYLLDEYIISGYSSSPTQEDIEHYTQRYEKYGYYANIDFTNDL